MEHHFQDQSNGIKNVLPSSERQQFVHLRNGAPLTDNGNALHFAHPEIGAPLRVQQQRQQIVHLRREAPLRDQSHGSKSYILSFGAQFRSQSHGSKSLLGHHFSIKATANISSIGAPPRNQSNGYTSCILALRHHFQPQRQWQQMVHLSIASSNSGPKQWEQFAHISMAAPLRGQSSVSKS